MQTAIPQARPRLTVKPVQRVDVMIWAEATNPGYLWGAGLDDGASSTAAAGGEAATREQMVEQVSAFIVHVCAKARGEVVVYPRCSDGVLRGLKAKLPSIARIRDFGEALSVSPQLPRMAHEACPGLLTGPAETVATDGSVSQFSGHAGFGWISSGGAFGLGISHSRDVVTVELAAIRNALARIRGGRGVFLTDSQAAIDLIGKYLSAGDGGLHSTRSRKAQLHSIERMPVRSVDLQKVKAHNGHWLNEGADRLARLARMASESAMPVKELWEAAAHIRDDVLQQR